MMKRSVAVVLLLLLAGVRPVSANIDALVDGMIAAHGGYEKWASAPSITFTDAWSGGGSFRVAVEQGSRRAYLASPDGSVQVAWDGKECRSVGWPAGGPPPRFMALLTWYFANLPWVVQDPGVQLEPGVGRLFDDPTEYYMLRMTYDAGVGDTPRDWYELYIHPDTKRLAACRYVVTYRSLLSEGAESTPSHVLLYDRWDTVDGLVVPVHFTIKQEDGSPYAECNLSGWSFREPFDPEKLDLGPAAVVDPSTP